MVRVKVQPSMSFGCLIVCAIWACMQCYTDCVDVDYWTCSNIAYLLILFYGMSGFWKYGRGQQKDRSPKIYSSLKFLISTYFVPLICVDLYLYNQFTYKFAYGNVVYPLYAFWCSITERRTHQKSIDVVNFLALCSLCFISSMARNKYGITAAFFFAVCTFAMKNVKICRMGPQDLKNYCFACVVIFTCKALVLSEEKWLNCTGILGTLR